MALRLHRKLPDGKTLTWSDEALEGVVRFDRSAG
jgi:hypothetical protein